MRIPPIDNEIALQAGVLIATARASGTEPDINDALIAATAHVHRLEVLTFNPADFRPMAITRQPSSGLASRHHPSPGLDDAGDGFLSS